MGCLFAALARKSATNNSTKRVNKPRGGESSTIYIRRGWINGVMVAKADAVVREFVQRWGIFFGHKIRAHAVPNDEDNVTQFSVFRGIAAAVVVDQVHAPVGRGRHPADEFLVRLGFRRTGVVNDEIDPPAPARVAQTFDAPLR